MQRHYSSYKHTTDFKWYSKKHHRTNVVMILMTECLMDMVFCLILFSEFGVKTKAGAAYVRSGITERCKKCRWPYIDAVLPSDAVSRGQDIGGGEKRGATVKVSIVDQSRHPGVLVHTCRSTAHYTVLLVRHTALYNIPRSLSGWKYTLTIEWSLQKYLNKS